MFRNYLATGLTILLKHRLFSLINIGGLAIGLAASERVPYQLGTADVVLLAAIAGLCALLIAALTVVNSAVRVAGANPLHPLRYE